MTKSLGIQVRRPLKFVRKPCVRIVDDSPAAVRDWRPYPMVPQGGTPSRQRTEHPGVG
jgi:hypothetical protein